MNSTAVCLPPDQVPVKTGLDLTHLWPCVDNLHSVSQAGDTAGPRDTGESAATTGQGCGTAQTSAPADGSWGPALQPPEAGATLGAGALPGELRGPHCWGEGRGLPAPALEADPWEPLSWVGLSPELETRAGHLEEVEC